MGLTYKYFQIQNDGRVANTPELLFEAGAKKKDTPRGETIQILVKGAPFIEYVDFIEKPFLLASDAFKRVAALYNSELNCQAVVLTEKGGRSQAVYWRIDLPKVDCFHLRKNNATPINKIVDTSKTGGLSFFKSQAPKDPAPLYVIRLDFAESVIRRGLVGFKLTGLECM